MSTQQFDQDTDESRRKLGDLLAFVSSSRTHGEEAIERFDETFPSVQTESTYLEKSLAVLVSYAGNGQSQVEQHEDSTTAALRELSEFATQFEHRAETSFAGFRASQVSFRDLLHAELKNLTASAEASGQHLETIRQKSEELASDVEDHQRVVDRAHSELTATVDQAREKVAEATGEVEDAVEHIESELTESLQTALKDRFASYSELVTSRLQDGFVENISDVQSSLDSLVDDFDTQLEAIAEDCQERVEALLNAVRDYSEKKVHDEVKEAIEDLVRGALTNFATEVIESTTITEVGAATTSALSPHVPEIVLLKKATGLINRIL